jgi:hypothetical protein
MNKAKDLKKFLLKASKSGYANSDESSWKKEKDGSTTIFFKKGLWQSHDNFFGGEPYGGRQAVFYKDKPLWIMVYYGWVKKGIKPEPVYKILRAALQKMPDNSPFRGPKILKGKEFIYKNSWQGDVKSFSGEEKILKGKILVYKANYLGGLVDQ